MIIKILGKKIFIPRNRESTSTICKIRNSKEVRIVVQPTSGRCEIRDLTGRLNPATNVESLLQEELKKLTDLTVSQEGKQYSFVDIGFPIPFLEVSYVIYFALYVSLLFLSLVIILHSMGISLSVRG